MRVVAHRDCVVEMLEARASLGTCWLKKILGFAAPARGSVSQSVNGAHGQVGSRGLHPEREIDQAGDRTYPVAGRRGRPFV